MVRIDGACNPAADAVRCGWTSGPGSRPGCGRLPNTADVYHMAIGLPGEPVPPTILSGAHTKRNSYTFSFSRGVNSRFSRFQMPRRVCSSVWHGTAYVLLLAYRLGIVRRGVAAHQDDLALGEVLAGADAEPGLTGR